MSDETRVPCRWPQPSEFSGPVEHLPGNWTPELRSMGEPPVEKFVYVQRCVICDQVLDEKGT